MILAISLSDIAPFMTPNQLRQVEELYHAARESSPEARAALLEQADPDLRREVQSLLEQDGLAGPMDRAAAEVLEYSDATPLAVGAQLGPYRIDGLLGEGGMGKVYKAYDSRLRRTVAIKIGAERFSERFEREARTVAALNHPNICTLHDIGPNYLVMELIEGPTLAERIGKGPVPVKEALAIARQIAEALEAAHDRGIVHRDLKPANVKLTAGGAVKVLDFGLAKALEPAAGSAGDSPTLTYSATEAGMILGTAGYMSPEQASGKPVDKRADIWAFGVVLWGLLTGHRLFEGETVTQTLAEVLRGPIDFDRLPRETPAAIRVLLRRCLDRNAKNRLRDIGEARIAIEAALAGETPLLKGAPEPGLWLAWTVAAVAIVLAAGLAPLAFLHLREKPPAPAAPFYFQIPLPEDGMLPALSPDGRKLAFVAGGRLWVHFLESGESRDLTTIGGVPFWSPDGRFIAYPSGGRLKRIEATGGTPQTVADLAGSWGPGAWNQDDVIVFGVQQVGLFRVPASGGVPIPITLRWILRARNTFISVPPSCRTGGISSILVPRLTGRGAPFISAPWTPNPSSRVPSPW